MRTGSASRISLKPIDLVCREHGSLAEAFSVVGPDGGEKQNQE